MGYLSAVLFITDEPFPWVNELFKVNDTCLYNLFVLRGAHGLARDLFHCMICLTGFNVVGWDGVLVLKFLQSGFLKVDGYRL